MPDDDSRKFPYLGRELRLRCREAPHFVARLQREKPRNACRSERRYELLLFLCCRRQAQQACAASNKKSKTQTFGSHSAWRKHAWMQAQLMRSGPFGLRPRVASTEEDENHQMQQSVQLNLQTDICLLFLKCTIGMSCHKLR